MSEVATVATGWGLTFVAVATYSLWVVRRGRTIGRELSIGDVGSTDFQRDADPRTDP